MTNYTSSVTDPHERIEELQWADILARGDARQGMLLVFVQKLCTALHEYGPSHAAGILPDSAWPFIRGRLLARTGKVLELAKDNGLAALGGLDELAQLQDEISRTATLPDLHALAERIHVINHRICDSLAATLA